MDKPIMLLAAIIGLIIFVLYMDKDSKNVTLLETNNFISSNKPKYRYTYNKKPNIDVKDVVDDIISYDGSVDSAILTKEILNPNFLYIQFHNDYRDVITALHNIVSERRQRFNLANIPIVYSEPEVAEVSHLVNDFIIVLNQNIQDEVPNYRNKNSGWDEAITDPNVAESGWDRVQKSLGLAPSLYDKPAKKCPVRLISIQYVRKYETDDEIRYVVDLVLQKKNVDDQIVLSAAFVQDKGPLHDENNFFSTKKVEMKVIIENLFITGYLSKEGSDSKLIFDGDTQKYFDYNQMEYNQMTDPKYIQHILMQKYKQRTMENDNRNAMLDEEGRNFHRELPNVYDFSNIKGTRTIFDDMNTKKVFI